MPERSRPPAYAIARVEVDVLIPVRTDEDNRRIGGELVTDTGMVAWDAEQALGYFFGAQDRMDEAGFGGRIIDGRVVRAFYIAESEPVEPLDWQEHRVSLEASDAR